MIALIQRVSSARVYVESDPDRVNAIGPGMVVLLGVSQADTEADCNKIAAKLRKLRIFTDENGKMNLDISAAKGELLLISQFTLLADVTGGNRPSFITAAPPELAKDLYQKLAQKLSETDVAVKTGFFAEYMQIETILDGPVTIYLDSKKL